MRSFDFFLARSLLRLLEMFCCCFRFVFLLFDKVCYSVPAKMSYTGTAVVVLCGRLSEVLAPQEGMFVLICRMKCTLVFINRRVWAFVFVNRTECLFMFGCRMECTECYCSHVCQQNSVHLCLPTKRSLCWYLSRQQGTFMFANHKCVCSCLPREESVCSCLSRQQHGCLCLLFAKSVYMFVYMFVYICLSTDLCMFMSVLMVFY